MKTNTPETVTQSSGLDPRTIFFPKAANWLLQSDGPERSAFLEHIVRALAAPGCPKMIASNIFAVQQFIWPLVRNERCGNVTVDQILCREMNRARYVSLIGELLGFILDARERLNELHRLTERLGELDALLQSAGDSERRAS